MSSPIQVTVKIRAEGRVGLRFGNEIQIKEFIVDEIYLLSNDNHKDFIRHLDVSLDDYFADPKSYENIRIRLRDKSAGVVRIMNFADVLGALP